MIYTPQTKKAMKLADLRHNSDLSRLDAVDEKALRRVEKYRQSRRWWYRSLQTW